MKVWKNKNMSEWSPETGTHYQQRITLGETEQKQYGLNYPVGTHYPNLSILDYFKGETFKKYKMDYCNTCIKIVKEWTKREYWKARCKIGLFVLRWFKGVLRAFSFHGVWIWGSEKNEFKGVYFASERRSDLLWRWSYHRFGFFDFLKLSFLFKIFLSGDFEKWKIL